MDTPGMVHDMMSASELGASLLIQEFCRNMMARSDRAIWLFLIASSDMLRLEYYAIQIATYEVAYDDAGIEQQYLTNMCRQEWKRCAQVIERIGYAVREAAGYEKRYAEEQWQKLPLASECHGCGHDEPAADGENSATQRTCGQTAFQHFCGSVLKRHGRTACNQCNSQTADDIAKQNKHQRTELTFLEETGCSGEEFQTIVNYRQQSECEKNCSDNVLLCQIAETCYADADTGQK